MKPLLIHADQGARSGFIASWLTDKLTRVAFDSGASLKPKFYTIHTLGNIAFASTGTVNSIINFSGVKIRVRPSVDTIDLQLFLFLKKAGKNLEYINKNEYSLTAFTNLYEHAKEVFKHDAELDHNLYDIVLNFADTFNYNFMIDLYKKVVGISPTQDMIDTLIKTNELNCIPIDKNHACSIVKLCFTQEQHLGLKEEHRFWSIVDIYNSTPVDQLYNTVLQSIVPENYGIFLDAQ